MACIIEIPDDDAEEVIDYIAKLKVEIPSIGKTPIPIKSGGYLRYALAYVADYIEKNFHFVTDVDGMSVQEVTMASKFIKRSRLLNDHFKCLVEESIIMEAIPSSVGQCNRLALSIYDDNSISIKAVHNNENINRAKCGGRI